MIDSETAKLGAPAPLIPAATIILLRDSPSGIEALLLRRNRALKAFGGAWVFPGGRVDSADNPGAAPLERAQAAAIRETQEEAGLDISATPMVTLSEWIPPIEEKRRFSTWFFVARSPDEAVKIDEGEIHDFQWIAPRDVIERTPDPDLVVLPPTFVSLFELAAFEAVDEALEALQTRTPERFETRFKYNEAGFVTLWPGDACYDDPDLDQGSGPYRRLVATQKNWTYLKTS